MYQLDKTNHATIMRAFNDVCSFIWPAGIQYDKVLLVLSDQASYMLLAFANLKIMFSKLHHVTCLAHCLHRVCESVRDEYVHANELILQMKKLLKKCPKRIEQYKEITGTSTNLIFCTYLFSKPKFRLSWTEIRKSSIFNCGD